MSIKISELPQASTVNNTDVIPIVQSGTTKQVTAGILQNPTRNYISIRNTANVSIISTGNWSSHQVKLTTLYYSSGSKFSLNDGAIRIGAGVSKIKATLNMAIQGGTNETSPIIRKKTSGETSWVGQYPSANFAWSGWFPVSVTTIIEVNEGDEIGAFFNTHTSGTLTVNAIGTALLVEEYESTDASTRSLNLTRSANTGELVGIGDRVELTNETKQDEEQVEKQVEKQVEQVKEQVENISAEPIETKTEGSGDTI